MRLREIVERLSLEVLSGKGYLERDISKGYCSDLLSDVIANIEEDSVWITIQRHINILGVAKLKDIRGIIIPRNLSIDQAVVEKAEQEDIPILRGTQSSFEIAGLLFCLLKKEERE
jgi:predicted transcriptional regulator